MLFQEVAFCIRSLTTPELTMMQAKCKTSLNTAYFFLSPQSICISSKKTVQDFLWWLSPVSILIVWSHETARIIQDTFLISGAGYGFKGLYCSQPIRAISNSHLAVPGILSYVSGKASSGTFLLSLHFINTIARFFINKLKAISTYSNLNRMPELENSKYPLLL